MQFRISSSSLLYMCLSSIVSAIANLRF